VLDGPQRPLDDFSLKEFNVRFKALLFLPLYLALLTSRGRLKMDLKNMSNLRQKKCIVKYVIRVVASGSLAILKTGPASISQEQCCRFGGFATRLADSSGG